MDFVDAIDPDLRGGQTPQTLRIRRLGVRITSVALFNPLSYQEEGAFLNLADSSEGDLD